MSEVEEKAESRVIPGQEVVVTEGTPADPSAKRGGRIGGIVAAVLVVCALTVVGLGMGLGWFGGSATAGDEPATEEVEGANGEASDSSGGADAEGAAAEGADEAVAGGAASEKAPSSSSSAPGSSSGSSGAVNAGGSSASSGSTPSSSGSSSSSSEAEPAPAPDPEPQTITVSVSIDSSRAASYGYASSMGSRQVTIAKGSSVYDALRAMGVSVGGSSSYVSSIGGLAEKACGSGSGWMYSVNGSFPNKSCGKYVLSGGESIRWVYTLEMGNDL